MKLILALVIVASLMFPATVAADWSWGGGNGGGGDDSGTYCYFGWC